MVLPLGVHTTRFERCVDDVGRYLLALSKLELCFLSTD